jgi:hypothetical protein
MVLEGKQKWKFSQVFNISLRSSCFFVQSLSENHHKLALLIRPLKGMCLVFSLAPRDNFIIVHRARERANVKGIANAHIITSTTESGTAEYERKTEAAPHPPFFPFEA